MLVALVMAAAMVSISPAAKPAVAPNISGAYKASIKGNLDGEGTVLVTPATVVVLGSVTDVKTKKKGALVSPSLGMSNGHFAGAGLVGTSPVQIIGRVEPADGTLIKAERVIVTISDGSGNTTRLLATK